VKEGLNTMNKVPFIVLMWMAVVIIEEREGNSIGENDVGVKVDLTVDVNGKRVITASKPEKKSNLSVFFPAGRKLPRTGKSNLFYTNQCVQN
jgi:hypothetical protein